MNLLIVTDHTAHTATNSLYRLAKALKADPRCAVVWVCSKGISVNAYFFNGIPNAEIHGVRVEDDFVFDSSGQIFTQRSQRINSSDIQAILIRMPQPFDPAFLFSLEAIVPHDRIVNRPDGIVETATKEFLLQVSYLCPEPVLCRSLEEAIQLSTEKEIVLKPLQDYGGRGIVRLSKTNCWIGNTRFDADYVHSVLTPDRFPMLAMKYLAKVNMGDKRTIVVHWTVVGSALRVPAEGHWMCNVAQGGHATWDAMDENEQIIKEILTPMLHRKGIVMFGFDTLVDDDGRRVLSEINTLSIGGLVPMEDLSGKPLVRKTAGLIWDYLSGEG